MECRSVEVIFAPNSTSFENDTKTVAPYVHNPCTQPYPELEKQAKWEVKVKPEAVDWDAEIAAVVGRGRDVPEVDWVNPGEDAAIEVFN